MKAYPTFIGIPVQIYWGNEWVNAIGYPQDKNTITAQMATRTGERKMCRFRNSKTHTSWIINQPTPPKTGGREGEK